MYASEPTKLKEQKHTKCLDIILTDLCQFHWFVHCVTALMFPCPSTKKTKTLPNGFVNSIFDFSFSLKTDVQKELAVHRTLKSKFLERHQLVAH